MHAPKSSPSSACLVPLPQRKRADPFHRTRNPQQGKLLFSNNKGILGSMKRIGEGMEKYYQLEPQRADQKNDNLDAWKSAS
jgi:hypothetical protein